MSLRSDTVVVGTKSLEAIEAAWMADLDAFAPARGRPQGGGWMTIAEMAKKAGKQIDVVRRWVRSCPPGYWEMKPGTVQGGSGKAMRTTYYRKTPKFLKRKV